MNVESPIVARAFLTDYCACVDDDKWAKQVLNGSKEQMDLVLCKTRELAGEGSALRYSKSVAGACNQRKVFATDKGYFSLGPPSLRDGDLVCVMFGELCRLC